MMRRRGIQPLQLPRDEPNLQQPAIRLKVRIRQLQLALVLVRIHLHLPLLIQRVRRLMEHLPEALHIMPELEPRTAIRRRERARRARPERAADDDAVRVVAEQAQHVAHGDDLVRPVVVVQQRAAPEHVDLALELPDYALAREDVAREEEPVEARFVGEELVAHVEEVSVLVDAVEVLGRGAVGYLGGVSFCTDKRESAYELPQFLREAAAHVEELLPGLDAL